MDNELYTNEFEEFLKTKADQHRLYPSEKVWKKIYATLHPSKGKMALLVMLFLFLFVNDQVFLLQTTKNEIPGASITNNEIAANNFLKQIQTGISLKQNKTYVRTFNQAIYSGNLNTYKWLSGSGLVLPTNVTDRLSSGLHPFASSPKEPKQQHIANTNSTLTHNDEAGATLLAEVENDPINRFGNIASIPVNKKTLANINFANTNINKKIDKLKESKPASQQPVISVARPKETNKLSIQYYFSPTISFRKLQEDAKHTSSQNLPLPSTHLDVNRFVNHSPTIGFEAGSSMLFPISRTISFKAGLQLNVNGYNIRAFTYSREKATIALKTPGPIGDTIATFTSIRNMSGYTEEILQNKYFQVSMPMGVDVKIMGDHRLQLNAAATIQPLYIVAHSTYLLSDDYNNYVKERSLVNRWNYAANLETYLSYSGGNGLKWQIGPQLRYQLKSTYSNRYPMKEYLMEYSIKFGIIKTLK